MKGSEGGTASDDGGINGGIGFDKGYHFIENIFIELVLADGLVCALHLFVHPAFGIDAVDRENLQLSGVNKGFQRLDEFKSFVFQVVCGRGGNHQEGKPIMAIYSHGHLFVERRAEPLMYLPDHLI